MQNRKKSTPRRSAEGAEARDFFIPCGAFGAAGAESLKYDNQHLVSQRLLVN